MENAECKIIAYTYRKAGLSRWLSGKESACNLQEMKGQSLGQEDSLEKEMTTHSGILAWGIP